MVGPTMLSVLEVITVLMLLDLLQFGYWLFKLANNSTRWVLAKILEGFMT